VSGVPFHLKKKAIIHGSLELEKRVWVHPIEDLAI